MGKLKKVSYHQWDIAISFGYYCGWELPAISLSDILGHAITTDQEKLWYRAFALDAYKSDMAYKAVELWNAAISDLSFLKDIQFIGIRSYYLGSTKGDLVECTCMLDETGMRKYIYKNKDKFWDHVQEAAKGGDQRLPYFYCPDFNEFMNPESQRERSFNRDIMIDWCIYNNLVAEPSSKENFVCFMTTYRDCCIPDYGPYF